MPALLLLYSEAGDYLLRNHCQAILSNVALLAENGGALRDAKTPEEVRPKRGLYKHSRCGRAPVPALHHGG